MPCYTVYLSTQVTSPVYNNIVPLDKTNLSNVSWRADWDNIFNKENYNYKYCRVRFYLTSESFTASVPPSADWTNYCGYLAVSLPSSYNATTTNGTILGLISPSDSPVTGTNIHCIIASTMSEIGVDINVPTSTQQLNISMINDNDFQFLTTFKEYQILLNFELYN